MLPDLTEVRIRGREAGELGTAAGLNPYPNGSLEAVTWETARIQTIAEKTLARIELERRAP